MIREIINFTQDLSPELFLRNLQPSEGLHIMVHLTDEGNLESYEYEIYKRKQEITPFLMKCLKREIHSKCVSMNKTLDSKKKIHSCSPFCLAFKLKTYADGEVLPRIAEYFDSAMVYCKTEVHTKMTNLFRQFCETQLESLLQQILEKLSQIERSPKKFKLTANHYIRFYAKNPDIRDYEEVHQNYLRPKVFNKEEFNVEYNGEIYGVSDYLTGYNQKKPFLQHRTAAFNVSARVSGKDALWLYRFSLLKANKQLPNPLPIFIEKRELNKKVVELFNREGERKLGYAEIIGEVYQRYQDLGNYYLLNIQGKAVKDFDFVSSFSFRIDPPIRIQPLFTDSGNLINKTIDNIFQFEREIVQRIFNNQLVQRTKNDGLRFRYFDDIEYKPQFISAAVYHLVLTYRKAFYDFIYKSKREAVNSRMFHDIMKTVILDEIKHDEQHNKSFSIKEKLNIWFSLYDFFEAPKTRGEKIAMANQVIHLQERMLEVSEEGNNHIMNDEEFAFAAGQLIYYLLSKSETGNKTHALLEPFLQKTDCAQFLSAIARTLERYKHNISFHARRFNKLASEVLGYSTEENLKKMMPLILAGYFSDNVLFQKNATSTDSVEEAEA